ncbi:MAG TPA: GFA family protein [Kofleriaceae bacterium]|nr:GFA family protein [Kofleriaceae bacterium]
MVTIATHTGGCLCGAVRYAIHGPMRDVVVCHCTQCRRQGSTVTVGVAREDFVLVCGAKQVREFESSPVARRTFCGACGSALFWTPVQESFIAIFAGTLDQPTGLRTAAHIFSGEKPDYETIADELPCYAGAMSGGSPTAETRDRLDCAIPRARRSSPTEPPLGQVRVRSED